MRSVLLLSLVAAAALGGALGLRLVVDENIGPQEKLDPKSCPAGSKFCPNRCLKDLYWCDGYADCEDGADEKNCSECNLLAFACDGKCWPTVLECDGTQDCKDCSDEASCGKIKFVDLFQCKNSSITRRKFATCDGHDDCDDGSDEKNCSALKCQAGSLWCDTETQNHTIVSVCLATSAICDGVKDCVDGKDEKKCPFEVEHVTIPKST